MGGPVQATADDVAAKAGGPAQVPPAGGQAPGPALAQSTTIPASGFVTPGGVAPGGSVATASGAAITVTGAAPVGVGDPPPGAQPAPPTAGGGPAMLAPGTAGPGFVPAVGGVAGGGAASPVAAAPVVIGGGDQNLPGIVPTAGTPAVTGGGPGTNALVIGGSAGGISTAPAAPMSPEELSRFGFGANGQVPQSGLPGGGPATGSSGCGMDGCSGGAGCTHHGKGAGQQPGQAPAAGAQSRTYVVRKGDTLRSIAKRFGVSAKGLREANSEHLRNGNPIPGHTLTIPGSGNGASGAAGTERKPASLQSLAKYPRSGSSEKQRIEFLHWAARQYGIDGDLLVEMARRESGLRTDAVNDWDINAKRGTPSKGILQFIEPTFRSFAPRAVKANPRAWEGLGDPQWLDWRHQALVAAWAVRNGLGSHWAVYSAAKQATGS